MVLIIMIIIVNLIKIFFIKIIINITLNLIKKII